MRLFFVGILIVATNHGPRAVGEQPDFDLDVRPILTQRCVSCHGGVKLESGLSFKSREEAFRLADSGNYAIVEGDPGKSELIRRVTSNGEERMPPDGDRLSELEVSVLRRWIETGARWERHWSFRPLVMPKLSTVERRGWVRNPVDRFILAELEQRGLDPSPQANRRTLIRRVALDITGLPPTREEIDRFVNLSIDDALNWYLDSPAYGERWGKYWLDAAGYADSNGYFHADTDRPFAWKYRDWVIDSLNQDQPFDEFIQWQLAGDRLARYEPGGDVTPDMLPKLVATHFVRNAPDGTGESDGNPQERQRDRLVVIEGNVANLASSLLGITIGCARCHDHPFEPVKQAEYYQLQAVLAGVYPDADNKWLKPQERLIAAATVAEQQAHERRAGPLRQQIREHEEKMKELIEVATKRVIDELLTRVDEQDSQRVKRILAVPPEMRTEKQMSFLSELKVMSEYSSDELAELDWRFADARKQLEKTIEAIRGQLPADLPKIAAAWEVHLGDVPHYVKERGVYTRRGQAVGPGVPRSLVGPEYTYRLQEPVDRRLALAEWITSPGHPLLARVTVNRIWQQHFGTGLVATAGNLGVSGERPSHPKLLDFLATWFVENGWSRKALHRLIVNSATYRQAATLRKSAYAEDPENRLLWRWSVRRLDAESIRDAMLSASGLLDRTRGGPYVPVRTVDGSTVIDSEHPGARRRSIYIQQRRTQPLTMMVNFDAHPIITNCTFRSTSTVPLQSLMLLNSRFARDCGQHFAAQLRRTEQDRIEAAFELAIGRMPREKEQAAAERFLRRQRRVYSRQEGTEDESWIDFCQMILASNAFLYVE